ncbi:MAG: hypothetical protein OEV34_08065 [Gammaproteobacteria bacterium]|jgi:hypothetical protein|nr:hypothetical protein [Gammaproteobacteria bacterium]
MHNQSSTHRVFTIAAVLAALLLSGCETTTNWLKGRKTADPTDELILDSTEANVYLNEMFELISGYPATQAEIFADAESAATLTPGPSTQLRYALVLATPGHSGSNDAEAQRLLRDILAQTEMMTTAETALATIYLRDVETRMVLNSESRRLRSASTQAATTEDAAISQRMARIEAENRQLRESLAEAEGKLEAITSIERSIREQSGDNDPQ